MTRDDTNAADPATDEAFQRALSQLIRRAAANGVSVEGGWEHRTTESHVPDRDIEIHRLASE